MRSAYFGFTLLFLCAGVDLACAQVEAPMTAGTSARFDVLHGGSARRIALRAGATREEDRVWISEDGGRIRRSYDGGAHWDSAAVPDAAAQTLLDIRFPYQSNLGYATGRAGQLLQSDDLGATWQHVMPDLPHALDAKHRPAIFWSVNFLPSNPRYGFAAGIATFQRTHDRGQSWTELDLFRDSSCREALDTADYELYAIHLAEDPAGGWFGCCIGEWVHHTPSRRSLGVVFYTHSRERHSKGGRRWWMTFCTAAMQEPWDLDFADAQQGFLVGGTGTASGCILRTEDGGRNWIGPEPLHRDAKTRFFATLYGIADLGGGHAIAVGYAGHIWVRDPATSSWIDHFVPGYTAPLLDVQGIPGTTRAWACGSFGFLRRTDDGGQTWESENQGEMIARLRGAALRDESVGLLVGQPPQILRTIDGGANFERVYPSAQGSRGVQLNAVTWLNADEAIAVGTDGLVLKSADQGRTWSENSTSGVHRSHQLAAVAARDAAEVWSVGHAPIPDSVTARVFRSMDGGWQWTRLPDPPNATRARLDALAFPSATQMLAIGKRHDQAYAVLYDSTRSPAWRDVSPPLGRSRVSRGLLSLTAGVVNGQTVIYVGGERGTLLRWNTQSEAFEGVAEFFEYSASSGNVTLQRASQDIAALGIDDEAGELFVGFHSSPLHELSPSHGYVWCFDGSTWTRVHCGTNQHARGFSFGGSGAQRNGWFIASLGPGGTSEGTIADSILMRISR